MEEERMGETMISYQTTAATQKFDGIDKLHPKIILKTLSNRIRGYGDLENIKEIVRENLQGIALVWF